MPHVVHKLFIDSIVKTKKNRMQIKTIILVQFGYCINILNTCRILNIMCDGLITQLSCDSISFI